jgi:DNA-binding MarR family transcriptional regulator
LDVSHVKTRTSNATASPRRPDSPAFLVAQVGAHAAAKFAERLSAIDLTPPHAGILRFVSVSGGISQQALAGHLGILPSRLVALIDQLEERGLVERRPDPGDRRSYALYITDKGRDAMKAVGRVARDHQEVLLAALEPEERDRLASLLARVAAQQGLQPGVHPGFSRLRVESREIGERPEPS